MNVPLDFVPFLCDICLTCFDLLCCRFSYARHILAIIFHRFFVLFEYKFSTMIP